MTQCLIFHTLYLEFRLTCSLHCHSASHMKTILILTRFLYQFVYVDIFTKHNFNLNPFPLLHLKKKMFREQNNLKYYIIYCYGTKFTFYSMYTRILFLYQRNITICTNYLNKPTSSLKKLKIQIICINNQLLKYYFVVPTNYSTFIQSREKIDRYIIGKILSSRVARKYYLL